MSESAVIKRTPLLVALAPEPDVRGFHEARDLAQEISESYSDEDQCSPMPVYAGTDATVCHSGTGNVFSSDTDYPTDDA